ncbi:2-hydroxyisoflavanone dehydratase-like [Silene latifolia]|uniref:2-hydroxyisoflavanone dehydratase-like n=1 Tax=Silene latifolia TaxID=37657 RepID=UPI003D781FA3
MAKKINQISILLFIFSLALLVTQTCSSHHKRRKHTLNQIVKVAPYIIDYGNGTIIRDPIATPSYSPPPNNPQVQSRDITVVSNPGYQLRARIIIPTRHDPARKIPVLLYFHGGAFCIGSAFGWGDTTYLARVSAEANVVGISLDYRLYPEHPVPAPYDDAWAALNWIAAHKSSSGPNLDPWLAQYGDLNRVFVGGDSSGGNIAHNLVIRATPGPVSITGLFLAMPYFLGSKRVPFEPATIIYSPNYRIWPYVCNKCEDGVDNKYINPFTPKAVPLGRLGCKKLLVYTAEIDELRGRGRWYYQQVKASGWKGQAQWIEAQGQEHIFHISKPQDPATTKLINDFSAFINN